MTIASVEYVELSRAPWRGRIVLHLDDGPDVVYWEGNYARGFGAAMGAALADARRDADVKAAEINANARREWLRERRQVEGLWEAPRIAIEFTPEGMWAAYATRDRAMIAVAHTPVEAVETLWDHWAREILGGQQEVQA